MEDPAKAKKLVEGEGVRDITTGTTVYAQMKDADRNHIVLANNVV